MAAKKTTKTNDTKATEKKQPAKTDSLGCRVGSQSAAINKALSAKPKTVAQLAEASGTTPARCRNHLRYLLAKELIVKTDDGLYRTPPKSKRKAK